MTDHWCYDSCISYLKGTSPLPCSIWCSAEHFYFEKFLPLACRLGWNSFWEPWEEKGGNTSHPKLVLVARGGVVPGTIQSLKWQNKYREAAELQRRRRRSLAACYDGVSGSKNCDTEERFGEGENVFLQKYQEEQMQRWLVLSQQSLEETVGTHDAAGKPLVTEALEGHSFPFSLIRFNFWASLFTPLQLTPCSDLPAERGHEKNGAHSRDQQSM